VSNSPTEVQGESMWERLRRRKVVQWGIAYAAGAWGLLQGLSYLAGIFPMPGKLQPLATIALAAGLPVVLVVAWYHGDRGQQRVTGAELAIITLLFLLGGGLFWRYDHVVESPGPVKGGVGPTAGSAHAPATTAAAPPNSIAVLPFVNMSGDPSNEYFSDGVSEEILNVLAQAPELQVAARTSSFTYKGKPAEAPEIARELKVRMLLEGSVRRQEDKVRITAQLIDAQTGFHVWSETYDRELKDIFAIQDEIARAIGEKMKVEVVGAAQSASGGRAPTSPEAHDHYLRGLALWQLRREDSLWKAVDEFNRAIAVDPGYAPAYGGLALVYAVIPDYTARISYEDAYARGTDAAEMALALDPSLPESYAALGNIAISQRRRTLGQALLQRAIALRPSFATAYQWLGTGVASGGDPETGLASLERASVLDPRSLIVAENHAYLLIALGRYEDAIARCRKSLEFTADFGLCMLDIGNAEIMRGRPEAARPMLVRAAEVNNRSAVPLVTEVVEALSGRGDKRAVARRLAGFSARSFVEQDSGNIFSTQDVPQLLMALGMPEMALDYIERHADDPGPIDWAVGLAALDPIRCEPRFQAVEKKLNIVDVRARGMCKAVSASL
jgi:adenylate cyclase